MHMRVVEARQHELTLGVDHLRALAGEFLNFLSRTNRGDAIAENGDCFSLGLIARVTRSSMLESISQDYVRTARAKGLVERLVVLRHALGNAVGATGIFTSNEDIENNGLMTIP